MDQQTYIVTFEGVSPADANRYAEELRNALLDATSDISVQRMREDPRAMDFGAMLVLVLGTPAVVASVRAIENWLRLRYGASITLKTANGEVIVQNITSKNAAELARLQINKQ